jgi:hypothetical protein
LLELFVAKSEAAAVLALEERLKRERGADDVRLPSCKAARLHLPNHLLSPCPLQPSALVGAVVRAKRGGRYELHRVVAVLPGTVGQAQLRLQVGRLEGWRCSGCMRADPALPTATATSLLSFPLRHHPPPPSLPLQHPIPGLPHVLPAQLSGTCSLVPGHYEAGGRQERAEFEARAGGAAGWDLAQTAAAAWRLKVSKDWGGHLDAFWERHGPQLLEAHLVAPQGIEVGEGRAESEACAHV